MVRRKQSATISPQQLKHFAVAAVVITGLLALFASGEDWGAQAQIEAANAKNRLAAAEAEKLGAKKLQAKLRVRRDTSQTMSMSDPSDFSGGGGGGGGRAFAAPQAGAIGGGQLPPPGTPEFDAAMKKQSKKKAKRPELTEEAREKLEAASRMRSGAE